MYVFIYMKYRNRQNRSEILKNIYLDSKSIKKNKNFIIIKVRIQVTFSVERGVVIRKAQKGTFCVLAMLYSSDSVVETGKRRRQAHLHYIDMWRINLCFVHFYLLFFTTRKIRKKPRPWNILSFLYLHNF